MIIVYINLLHVIFHDNLEGLIFIHLGSYSVINGNLQVFDGLSFLSLLISDCINCLIMIIINGCGLECSISFLVLL